MKTGSSWWGWGGGKDAILGKLGGRVSVGDSGLIKGTPCVGKGGRGKKKKAATVTGLEKEKKETT